MSKTTMNLRVDEKLKKNAEKITKELGIPMSLAVTLFLKAVVREKGLPFSVSVDSKKKKILATSIYEQDTNGEGTDETIIDQDALKSAIDKL
jgi:DNA-damage-inducible protein J